MVIHSVSCPLTMFVFVWRNALLNLIAFSDTATADLLDLCRGCWNGPAMATDFLPSAKLQTTQTHRNNHNVKGVLVLRLRTLNWELYWINFNYLYRDILWKVKAILRGWYGEMLRQYGCGYFAGQAPNNRDGHFGGDCCDWSGLISKDGLHTR